MDIVAIGLFLFLILALVLGYALLNKAQGEENLERRLNNISYHKTDKVFNTSPFPNWLKVSRFLNIKDREKLKAELNRAGFISDQAINYLLLSKLAFALLAAIAYLAMQEEWSNQVLILTFVIAVIANMIPEYLVKSQAKKVRLQIARDLPQCLDLMVICAESGLTIDSALLKVSEAMGTLSPAISREFKLTYYELQLPIPRDIAWTNLAKRNHINSVDSFSYIMRQTEKYGTSLAPALREIAAETREITMLELEEKIGKISGKMSIPLMIFIVIPLVVMLAGPALISLTRTLTGE